MATYDGESVNAAVPGIKGRNTAVGGKGVYGESLATTSSNGIGVYGESKGDKGVGVSGKSDNWIGVYGESHSGNGVGGLSHHTYNAGVTAVNDKGGFGLWASSTGKPGGGNGIAAHFEGDFEVLLGVARFGPASFNEDVLIDGTLRVNINPLGPFQPAVQITGNGNNDDPSVFICPTSAPVRHMWTASWQALFSR